MASPSETATGCGCLVVLFVVSMVAWESCSSKTETKPSAPLEIVSNSAWDASVWQVKDYLRANVRDPDSLQFAEWSAIVKKGDGFYVRCKYRAKNGFGGYEVLNQIFFLDGSGKVVKVVDTG